MSVFNLLQGLDDEQKKAVTLETNGVVAAGTSCVMGAIAFAASYFHWTFSFVFDIVLAAGG